MGRHGLPQTTLRDTWVCPCVLCWDLGLTLIQETVLERQWDAAVWGGGGEGQDKSGGAQEGTHTGAENRVGHYHGFRAARRKSLRHRVCQAPGWAELGTRREADLSIPGLLCCDGVRTGTEGPSRESVGFGASPRRCGLSRRGKTRTRKVNLEAC